MNRRSNQFGVRENTASSRRHASRLAVHSNPTQPKNPSPVLASHEFSFTFPNDAAHNAATAGERDESHLLTVNEVSKLLQVPVSWVYGRTRKRSVGRLPGYRLGKYWRFREAEIFAWLKSQDSCTGSS